MTRALCFCLLVVSGLVARQVAAEETFAGQIDLAAGLACHRNLDLACAQERLEQALAEFSADGDVNYMAHVRKARMTLALIHVARDDLLRAEKEFYTLLLLDPAFALPPGDHPPKLKYVLDQAQRRLNQKPEPKPDAKPGPKPEPKPVPPVVTKTPKSIDKVQPKASSDRNHALWADLRMVVLLGDDADAASSGVGAGLAWRFWPSEHWGMGVRYAYAYHPLQDESRDAALQSMALGLEALTRMMVGIAELHMGLGVGAQSMGTRDRYDHWGALMHARIALVWPAKGPWALSIHLEPSLLVGGARSSFFLPMGLSGAWRW